MLGYSVIRLSSASGLKENMAIHAEEQFIYPVCAPPVALLFLFLPDSTWLVTHLAFLIHSCAMAMFR
jgi:hypothetical protein